MVFNFFFSPSNLHVKSLSLSLTHSLPLSPVSDVSLSSCLVMNHSRHLKHIFNTSGRALKANAVKQTICTVFPYTSFTSPNLP